MSEPEPTPGDGLAPDVRALHENLLEHYAFHQRLAGSEFHRDPDVAWFLSGRPANFLNAVMSATFSPLRVERRVDEVLAALHGRSVPLRWWTDDRAYPADLNGALERRGFEMKWDVPGMVVDLLNGLRKADPSRHIEVGRVSDLDDLWTWFSAFAAGFGFDPNAERAWFEAFEELGVEEGSPLRHYIGFADREAAASATVFLGADAAGIYHVGTRPDARRRGLGTAVTLAPLVEAREAGVRWGVLKASHLGRGVYERMGFVERARLRQYRWSPEGAAPSNGRR